MDLPSHHKPCSESLPPLRLKRDFLERHKITVIIKVVIKPLFPFGYRWIKNPKSENNDSTSLIALILLLTWP